jgi:hypothetical protein
MDRLTVYSRVRARVRAFRHVGGERESLAGMRLTLAGVAAPVQPPL